VRPWWRWDPNRKLAIEKKRIKKYKSKKTPCCSGPGTRNLYFESGHEHEHVLRNFGSVRLPVSILVVVVVVPLTFRNFGLAFLTTAASESASASATADVKAEVVSAGTGGVGAQAGGPAFHSHSSSEHPTGLYMRTPYQENRADKWQDQSDDVTVRTAMGWVLTRGEIRRRTGMAARSACRYK
jgi:hypothetical protein